MSKFISMNKKNLLYIAITLVIAIFFGLDRLLKLIAINLQNLEPIRLIGNFFYFHFAANTYMAFSLPWKGPLLNILIIIVIILLLSYIIYLITNNKPKDYWEIILLSIILAGALSNMLDRLMYGYVIDYLDLKYFTIFNLADVMISTGAGIIIFRNIWK